MKFRFTIGKKIGFGFGLLIALTLLAFILTQSTLDTSRKINDEITHVINPSVEALEELNVTILRSKLLITNWAYIQHSNDNEDKKKLKELLYEDYPAIKEKIQSLKSNWSLDDQNSIAAIFSLIDLLFNDHKDIMALLNTFDSYEDPINLWTARNSVEEGDIDIRTRLILQNLSELISSQRERATKVTGDMLVSFSFLQTVVRSLGITLLIGGILIAFFTVRGIVKRIDSLKDSLLFMSKGIEPEKTLKFRDDEIGEMTLALKQLMEGVKRTRVFANEVGSGNFEWEYQPLSDKDTLGFALLKMRDDLRETERILEQKVEERTMEVVQQKEEIDSQRQKLEYLYNQVTDSIKYAKRIQDAILPPDDFVKKLLPESFILFKPKDIVSGDFYWMEKHGDKVYFAAVDCTGHGVPGAFMSIVGYNLLKHVVTKLKESDPALILNFLNVGVTEALHQGLDEASTKDGMDISLCVLDLKKSELQFAGAYNPLWIIRKNEPDSLTEIKGDKFPIGMVMSEERKRFTNHKMKLNEGDCIYIFSDGYADQFGGEKKKKFMAKRLRDLLIEIKDQTMQDQKSILENTLAEWQGEEEQVDDVLVMGVRY